MSDKFMSFLTTKAIPADRLAGRRDTSLPRLTKEPRDLWPSKRGTEIAHIRTSLDRLEASVLKRLSADLMAVRFDAPDHSHRAILIGGLAGERAVTIVEEADHASGVLAVIADAGSDRGPILTALRGMFRGIATVTASPLDRPFGQ